MAKPVVTSASSWKKTSATGGGPVPLEVPSGNTCLVQPLGVDAFVRLGLIPNELLSVVMNAVGDADAQIKGGPEALKKREKERAKKAAEAMQALTADPEKVQAMFEMADAVTVHCVIEPRVLPTPNDPSEDRDPDALYVDEIDIEDKMFVTSYAMSGVRDVESFRKELAERVESLT